MRIRLRIGLFCYCLQAKVLPCLSLLWGSRSSDFTIRGPTLCSVTAAGQRFFPACHSPGGTGDPALQQEGLPTLCSVTAAWQRFFPACHTSWGPGVQALQSEGLPFVLLLLLGKGSSLLATPLGVQEFWALH